MRGEKNSVPFATWIVAALVAAVAVITMVGCGSVFGLSGYSFDETTLDDGGDVDGSDAAVAHPDAAMTDAGTDGADAAPSCTDKVLNGSETDIDCGGTTCPKCAGKMHCALPTDCAAKLACVDQLCLSPNANDGVQDGDETDVDCGGTAAPGCGTGLMCKVSAQDCVSKNCGAGVCLAATSTDKIKNGLETDTDCGGGVAPVCADGLSCLDGFQDCASRVCTNKKCKPPTATDTYQNGTETDVDCGGASAPACIVGKMCVVAKDCVSIVCTNKVCIAGAPNDGVKNNSETDVDCGGGAAPACVDGKMCNVGSDCTSRVCSGVGGTCKTPTATDGVKNGTETDIDCGGASAPPCADTKACSVKTDCQSGVCGAAGSCSVPSTTDGVKNGLETDIDCGGAATNPACADLKACSTPANGPRDCRSKVCAANVCQPPTSTDGQMNGTETDVDCGGGAAPLCVDGKGCTVNAPPGAPPTTGLRDCVSKVCAMGTCTTTFTDGVKNGTETDVDCGGGAGATPKCAAGLVCALPADCVSGSCNAGFTCDP